jgi:predicted nucleic acid-binding protein
MILADTNIVINATKPGFETLLTKLAREAVTVNWIIKIEALGWRHLKKDEQNIIRAFFNQAVTLEQNEDVYETAIQLRKTRHIKTPDAIIAATALCYNIVLWTSNTDDFSQIKGLKLVNPLQ